MTNKQKMQNLVGNMPEEITWHEVLYRVNLLIGVEQGLADCREGRLIDHDELFDRLEKEDEESQAALVGKSRKRPSRTKSVHRAGRPKNGAVIREAAKAIRK